ncbi:S-layer homology domain-containing protein [Sedimentibacter sp. zth1]|uniref:S-layer homology domain-containing protein n=1 Tax=Sedimentibacter sp. zth1 TaxID=2816908 RepID=UPI001A90E8B9|nr:S-layer homology domain-containing protein [Sedimentibacter sp. zth1]QSX06042.1 S-layer homology domain-containing protein [Sedimentibacter sp. zth1]
MKKFVGFVLILILIFSLTTVASAEVYYSDTVNHWSSVDVNIATNVLNVFRGYSDMTFRPDNNITRSEFITILVRTGVKLGLLDEVYTTTMKYGDMENTEWSYTYVISYYEYMKNKIHDYKFEDIFKGYYFYPDKPITREESILLISALLKNSIYDNDIIYNDLDKSYKYYDEVKTLSSLGVLIGYSDGTLKLYNNITRGESAALIRRIYDNAKTFKINYLDSLQYMPIAGEDVLPFFGTYSLSTKDPLEKKYIKAKNTLEYLAFGGYIFEEDKHLYDNDAIGTLKTLKDEEFSNIAGVNFYLLKFGNVTTDEKVKLSNEILLDIANRNDLNDSELMQLFNLIKKYNTTEAYYMNALSKWYGKTNNTNAIINIKTLRYEHFIKVNNYTYVRNLIYKDAKANINIESMLNLNWNLEVDDDFDFLDFTDKNIYYSMYTIEEFNEALHNPYNKNMVILKNYVLVDDIIINSNIDFNNEELFYKYSKNKAYILYTLGQYERAFIETINDYKVVKNLKIYKTNRASIDENYTGILNMLKDKIFIR